MLMILHHMSADNIDEVVATLTQAAKTFKWLKDDLLKGNADKCHLLVSCSNFIIY